MSDDAKLHMREKELLQSELQESERHAKMANEQIRSLTEKLRKVESDKYRSPKLLRKSLQVQESEDDSPREVKQEVACQTCAELQSVKNQLNDELIRFKTKAEELEIKVEEINDVWVSKSAASEKEKQNLEQKLSSKTQECKRLEDQLAKLREEDRMKGIFLKERDNNLKDKTAQIARKDEIIQEQEDIIRTREDDLQNLFDQISMREKTMKEMTEKLRKKDDKIKQKDEQLKQMAANIDEKNEELHFLEEEVNESNIKRKESETVIAEMQEKIGAGLKGEKSELEIENERLQADLDNLMGNITELHSDKQTLENELDKAKQALSEAMLMWDRDRSTLGLELNKAIERVRLYELTSKQKESQALQLMRKELHNAIDAREKLSHELRITKMEHDNSVRLLKTEKFKLTEELTSKIRMLAHEMSNNDKMSDELTKLRGQDELNYQLHHHEKILRAEYMASKVRYESQLERLQREHMALLAVVEKLQQEKKLDKEIITGIQRGMSSIKETYTHDLSRWKDEKNVLESHITQIEEGKEIAQQLRAQIDALKQQLSDQDLERSTLVNNVTKERRNWDVEKANLNSRINQLEEQLAVFIQYQSKNKDVQYRMEIAWEKERDEQKRLLAEAHHVALDLQEQLHKRDEAHGRERKNLLEQMEKHRQEYEAAKLSSEKMSLELNTGETRYRHLEQELTELREKHRKEQDFWVKEKSELLRRLAEMRKLHVRDVRRIDDVLASLKRLRELAAIVIESDSSATLPSNGSDGASSSGDASAASASTTSGEGEISDLKQNIDQVILKYVKESLRQLHFAVEELAKPATELSREDKQKIRRSLSSSEIELLKDEFLLGNQEQTLRLPNGKPRAPEVSVQRSITHDGNDVNTDHIPPDYIENILMEQSSFYNDSKDTKTEIHRVKTTKDITRVETKITSLPKPPPSFIIPRSRSTSPSPHPRPKPSHPVIRSIPVDTSHRLSAPAISGASSRSSSADSSPIGHYPSFIPPTQNGHSLGGAGALQSGSLDRLSPSSARRKFFEDNTNTYMSLPDRKQQLSKQRNSRSLSNSSDLCLALASDHPPNPLRISVSMDDGTINASPSSDTTPKLSKSQGTSDGSLPEKHSGLRDMFKTMKRKLKPKLKRSHSAREPDRERLNTVVEGEKNGGEQKEAEDEDCDELHVRQEQMTPIEIPDVSGPKSKPEESKRKSRSRSPSGRKGAAERDGSTTPETTLQKIKRRFRSKSAERTRDHQVKPILVGRSTGSDEKNDPSWHYSETKV